MILYFIMLGLILLFLYNFKKNEKKTIANYFLQILPQFFSASRSFMALAKP